VECLGDFLDSILQDTQPKVTAFDGRQVTAVLEAISQSLATGSVCAVQAPDGDQNG